MARKFLLKWRSQITKRISTEFVLVDDAHSYLLRSYPWRATRGSSSGGVAVVTGKQSTGDMKYLSHIIANAPEGMSVIHLNRDSLDNRLSNLRVCEKKEAQAWVSSYERTPGFSRGKGANVS